jgi:hypothetical protein
MPRQLDCDRLAQAVAACLRADQVLLTWRLGLPHGQTRWRRRLERLGEGWPPLGFAGC